MKDFPGTPGTVTGLVLRIFQCLFAAGSIASVATSNSIFSITAFSYLIASMGLQVIWSSGLAFLDAYALARKKVTATLSLAAASATAGITVLSFSDFGGCGFGEECQRYQMAVALAFFGWNTIAISSLIMFWLLAAGIRSFCCGANSVEKAGRVGLIRSVHLNR
ncbi:CASP-like protein 5B3 isoform X2 [Cornus florida]|uniref:CASP-like protein 5B3 isoform X2 n=1 Tax=Cornus florida TaxID=4283 RepID=UPI00289D1F17|nr:CASP-like protein 5B3 isoform X2 [Cornus florida]